MNAIQFRMIFRGWIRNKVYTVISLLSLVIGLTCCVLMVGFVMNEFRIASAIPDSEQWYMLTQKNDFYSNTEVLDITVGSGNAAVILHDRFPEVQEYCVFHECSASLIQDGIERCQTGFFEVLPVFKELFRPVVLFGDLKQTLSHPGEIAVTRSFALEHFGKENVTGEILEFNEVVNIRESGRISNRVEKKDYTVTSVIDDSYRSFLQYKILRGLPDTEIAANLSAWTNSYYSFVKLDDGITPEKFEKKVAADTTIKAFSLLGMKDVYFTPNDASDSLTISRDRSLLYIGLSIAFAVLVIACFNYINLSMTRALQRLRNTGQQMVFGASRRAMRMQLTVETGCQVLLSLCMALLLIYKILPEFNSVMNARLQFSDLFSGATLSVWCILLSMIIILPSAYIFPRLSEIQLHKILKQDNNRKSRLVTGMVVAQFVISIVLLIFVVDVHRQMYFISHNRPEADHIMTIEGDYEEVGNVFRQRLVSIPEIAAVTTGSYLKEYSINTNGISVDMINGDEYYFDFYHLDIVEGKPFGSKIEGMNAVVVNEAFVRKRDLKEPIGHLFEFNGSQYTICGVVRDFVNGEFTRAVEPLMIVQEEGWQTIVKMKKGVTKEALIKMQSLWKELAPGVPIFTWKTMADSYLSLHQDEQKMQRMVLIFSYISLILTCLGLFGLAWYSVENRMKEIALRKVSGATEIQVIHLLCSRFIKWIVIAFLIALPVAYYFSREWFMQFVYRADISVWTFIGVGIFAFAVGLITVIWQSWRAATANPVESLKSE